MHSTKINQWCDEAGGFVAMEAGGGGHNLYGTTMGGQLGNAYDDYQPPKLSYSEQQSQVVEDSMYAYIRADSAANNVLMMLQMQRLQLQKANDDTWKIRSNSVKAQQHLKELQQKSWKKKQCLYAIIAALAFVDWILLHRLIHCGGRFICKLSRE